MADKLKIFSGRPSRGLTQAICSYLGVNPGKAEIFKFSNNNTFVKINENVREADVFVVQTSCPPVDQNFMELLIMIDALKRASARRLTAVLPYYPYGRSDKKDQPRVPITARLVADLLTVAGADRVVTMDLHADQIQGFFQIPLDHLTAFSLLSDYFVRKKLENPVVVACDAGRAKDAHKYAQKLRAPLAIMDKRRIGNQDKVEIACFIGDVYGRNAVIFDDEVDTAGTLTETVAALERAGIKDVHAACTHPVFSGPAVERLIKSSIKEMVITDTVPFAPEKRFDRLTVLSVAPLFAEAIRRIHLGESISSLFG